MAAGNQIRKVMFFVYNTQGSMIWKMTSSMLPHLGLGEEITSQKGGVRRGRGGAGLWERGERKTDVGGEIAKRGRNKGG